MPRLSGLYAITPAEQLSLPSLVNRVEQVIAGGARLLQYRNKGTNRQLRLAEASALLSVCRKHDVLLIINDDLSLAQAIGADGVHLGREDTAIVRARTVLGTDAIIGASCYNDFTLALAASQAGASYVAFGSFFPSGTKPEAVPASLELLQQAKSEIHLPVVAIGGITPQNAPPLIAAGADMLAAIEGVFAQPDIKTAAAAFAALFES